MSLLSFLRRRGPVPADLPLVSGASMPGALHSGLTGDEFTAAAVLDGAQLLAQVVTESAVKTAPAADADNRICAYKDPYTGQLACPPCYADDVSVFWTARIADDLPNGGLCAFCGVDVLIEPTEPGVVATEWPAREPRRIEQPLGGLAPLGIPAPLWKPGIYTVTYDRVGDYGRRGSGIPPIMPLICQASVAGDLAQRIADDVDMLICLRVTAVVDELASGGHILGEGGARIGSFTFAPRKDAR